MKVPDYRKLLISICDVTLQLSSTLLNCLFCFFLNFFYKLMYLIWRSWRLYSITYIQENNMFCLRSYLWNWLKKSWLKTILDLGKTSFQQSTFSPNYANLFMGKSEVDNFYNNLFFIHTTWKEVLTYSQILKIKVICSLKFFFFIIIIYFTLFFLIVVCELL